MWQIANHYCKSNLTQCLLLRVLFLYGFFLCSRAEQRSVPLPIYMENKLNAGREIYDKMATPTQIDGEFGREFVSNCDLFIFL